MPTRTTYLPTSPAIWQSITLAAVCGLAAGFASAQSAGELAPPEDPASSRSLDEFSEDNGDLLPRRQPATAPVRPVRSTPAKPVVPGLTSGEDWREAVAADPVKPRGQRLPEGVVLVRVVGHVVTLERHRIFVPEHDADGKPVNAGPMLLLPSQTLEAIDRTLAASSQSDQRVSVTGEVTSYHGLNYLLPTAFGQVRSTTPAQPTPNAAPTASVQPGEVDPAPTNPEEPDPASTNTPDVSPDTAPNTPAVAAEDPDVEALVAEIQSSRREARGISRVPELVDPPPQPELFDTSAADRAAQRASSNAAAVADAPPAIHEGGYISRRRARLVRESGGAWVLRFDNDTDAPATGGPARDVELLVLPCELLMEMERRAMLAGDRLDLLVSGRVFAYGSRSAILPTLYQIARDDGIDPRQ